jgi:hypothetical protein
MGMAILLANNSNKSVQQIYLEAIRRRNTMNENIKTTEVIANMDYEYTYISVRDLAPGAISIKCARDYGVSPYMVFAGRYQQLFLQQQPKQPMEDYIESLLAINEEVVKFVDYLRNLPMAK